MLSIWDPDFGLHAQLSSAAGGQRRTWRKRRGDLGERSERPGWFYSIIFHVYPKFMSSFLITRLYFPISCSSAFGGAEGRVVQYLRAVDGCTI